MHRHRFRAAGIACVAPLLFVVAARPALAAPVSYVEGVGGDLTDTSPPFTLDSGLNTITGTFSVNEANIADFDPVAFVIPSGLKASSGALVLTDATGDVLYSEWDFYKGSTVFATGTFIGTLHIDSPGSGDLPGLPLAANSYNLWPFGFLTANDAIPSSADWTLRLDVQPVPEPAVLSLVSAAVFPLLARRSATRSRREVRSANAHA